MTGHRCQREQDVGTGRRNRTSEQDSRDKTAGAGLLGPDNHSKTALTGHLGQDNSEGQLKQVKLDKSG